MTHSSNASPHYPHIQPPLCLEGVLSAERCEAVIELFERSRTQPRSYQGLVDDNVRKCAFVKLSQEWDPLFARIAVEHMRPYYEREIDTELRDRPMVYGYPVGVGFVPHHDLVTEIELERAKSNNQPVIGGDYTAVIFLSKREDYGGGELYFPKYGWSYRPPRGTAIIYPATAAYVHGVKPITQGVRHVVVARYYHQN